MIKKILLFLIIALAANILFAQQTFEKTIINPDDQISYSVVEDGNGNYILAGLSTDTETLNSQGYIIKIDSTGLVTEEKYFKYEESISSWVENIHYFNEHYYLLGSVKTDSLNEKMWYLKLNLNLEVEEEKLIQIPSKRDNYYMNSIIDSDTNIVVTGFTTRKDTLNSGGIIDNFDAYFYKLNINGDSLYSKFYTTTNPLQLSFDIIESVDSTKYYAFVTRFTDIFVGEGVGQMLILEKNMDSVNIYPIPHAVHDYSSPVFINDTSMIISGKGNVAFSGLYALYVMSITEQAELINYNHFKKDEDMRDFPAIQNGVSKNEENIYVGGTSNIDYYNPYFSSNDSWFHLVKINSDITPIWEYYYGGDAYYHLYSILATNDGGCIMVGNRYDDATQYNERDIYIVKVDGDGLITWEQEITIDNQSTTVYPNPGTNQLNIATNNKHFDFELIDINGQVIIKQLIDNNYPTINTELLKSGIYFYKITNNKVGTMETGKWIKR